MTGYGVVLALHLVSLVGAFFLSGALHVSEYLMKGAGTMAEVRRLTKPAKFAPLFALFVIGLFGAGMGMLHMDEGAGFKADQGWVWTAMVVLLLLFLDGPLVLARYGKKLDTLVEATPDGPVTPEVQAQVRQTVPWVVSHVNTFAAAAVIFNMTSKPGTGVAIVTIVIGAGVGAAVGFLLSKR